MGSWPERKSPARRPLYGSWATQQRTSLIRCSRPDLVGKHAQIRLPCPGDRRVQRRARLPLHRWRLLRRRVPAPLHRLRPPCRFPGAVAGLPRQHPRGAPAPAFLLRHHHQVLVGAAVTGEVAAGGRILPRYHRPVPNRPAAQRLASAAPTVNTGLSATAANPANFVCILLFSFFLVA